MKSMEADINGARRHVIPAGSITYRMFSALLAPSSRERPRAEQRAGGEEGTARREEGRARQEECKQEEDGSSEETCFTSDNNLDKLQDIPEEEPFKEVFFLELEGKNE